MAVFVFAYIVIFYYLYSSQTNKTKTVMIIRTVNGYDFFEVSSAMQKAIRRGDAAVAGFFALELWTSGYRDYVWKRLYTISAEDCYGLITTEIEALWQGHELVNKDKREPKGRIFVSKAVLLLCECRKSRDADHLQNFVYDYRDVDVDRWIEDVRAFPIPIPPYTYDVHTRYGKKRGRTKAEFFREEFEALNNRVPGLFDGLVPD